MIRGFLRTVFGFLVAMLVAGVVQVLFARPPSALVGLAFEQLRERLEMLALLALAVATHSAIFAAMFGAIAILLGEWLHLRAATYYVLVGLGIALAGFLAQFAAENAVEPTIVNTYALLAYGVTGLVGGYVYWLFSGRHAGGRRPRTDRSGPSRRIRTVEASDDSEPAEVAVTTAQKPSANPTSVPTTHGNARLKVV